MAYVPNSGSVLAFQGTVPFSVQGITSVSGTVGASLIGLSPVSVSNFPATQAVITQPSIAVNIIAGSIAASFTPPLNQSVSGTVQVDVRGSVATVIIGGSIAASFTPPANQSVSGTVGASLIGLSPVSVSNFPANQSVSGTVNIGSLLSMQGYVSTGNSISSQLSTSSVFTGTWEEVKDFSAIYITVNSDVASATNGLSLQRSTNATSVMTSDEYTIPAQTGKTYQIQPDARFFRVQYTNSAANQGFMALQTVYKQSYSKPSSQRPSDGYTNETDLEQMQSFGMVWNTATWDRLRGNATNGLLTYGSVYGNIAGSVVAFQGTTPWLIGSVYGNISGSVAATITNTNINVSGSVAAFQAGTQITSLVSTVPSSVLVGASIFGQLPGGTAVLGSVAALQGTNPWIVVSSLAGGIFPVSGSVSAVVTNTVNVNSAGSVVAFQGTSPWVVNFQNSSILAVPVGSTIALLQSPSIVGTYVEDAAHTTGDRGIFNLNVRNDTMASITSADLDYSPMAVGPSGEVIVANSPITKWVYGTTSIVSGPSVAVIAAQGASIFTNVTGLQIANFSGNNLTGTISTGAGASSVLVYFSAPANGGSNMVFPNPIRSRDNTAILASISGVGSVYFSAQGFISKS